MMSILILTKLMTCGLYHKEKKSEWTLYNFEAHMFDSFTCNV
jgi:hypothetical protein